MNYKLGTILVTSCYIISVILSWSPTVVSGIRCYLCQHCNDPYRPRKDKFYLDRRRDFFGMREDRFFQCKDAALCYKTIPKEDEDMGVYLHRFPIKRGCRYKVTHSGCREEFDYYYGFAVDVCVCDSDFCNHGCRLMAYSWLSLVIVIAVLLL
ncbi:hypothetical protein LSH36_169g04013 [Paralvinella palmiformis]|uniref:Protein quiver n=1 Tax=Paralvinella palmiformis TaxID=53620 RepID=A0AAD9JTN9_9ANNE|nr:hypothetical protein LSH36_169g04013 [Paralvinella palmiformis]